MAVEQALITFQPSPIHGCGGFARCARAAGTRIIEYVGEKIDQAESNRRCRLGNNFVFALDAHWNLDGSVGENPARLLNHSCAANAEAQLLDGHIWIVARRDLAAGEEITFNYNYDLIDYREHPCRCGAVGCVGFMVAEELFDHVRAQTRRQDGAS